MARRRCDPPNPPVTRGTTMSIDSTGPAKVKGPASYFPSIEKTYGQPIEHWLDLVRAHGVEQHMQTVAWLKSEHG
eukprot:gene34847-biopygen26995